MAKQSQYVDLFGNSTLNPRQIAQQQIAESVREAEASFANTSTPTRTAAAVGAGLGGLFRQALMDSGMIEKDPEQARAEKLSVIREQINKSANDNGVDLTKDPEAFASLAVKHFMDADMAPEALKALQLGQIFKAQKSAAALEAAKLEETKAKTDKDRAEAEKFRREGKNKEALDDATITEKLSQAQLNQVKAEGLKVLTQLKKSDPNRAKVEKFNSIMASIEKNDGKITPVQRKLLDEMKGFDPINKLLGQTLGAIGAPEMTDKPGSSSLDFDFSGKQ